jgi:hypothetical protein
MNAFLWVLQIILAAGYAVAGLLKTTQPIDKLAPRMPWTGDFSARTVRFVGGMEILGALGLILPAATGIATVLTPLAATGLAVTMVLAVGLHYRRNELNDAIPAVVLFILAAIVAWGRFGPYSF